MSSFFGVHSINELKKGQTEYYKLLDYYFIVNIQLFFEKGCRKNVHATILKGNMGYDQYNVSDDCTCRTYFSCFPLALANTFPPPFAPILSNFFKEQ